MENLDYTLSEEKIDKILKKYFDIYFNDSVIKSDSDGWYGFYRPNGVLLIGRPNDGNKDVFYYDGTIFSSVVDMFNLSIEGFREAMKRYIKNRYDVKIGRIF